MDDIGEAFLADVAGLVELDTVSGFDDADVRGELGEFGCAEVAVFLSGVVAGVEDADSGDVHHEHGGTQDVAGGVTPETDSVHF